jgi:hypothetical protein
MPIINYLAVLVAGVAGWLVGAAWYGVLGKAWMDAAGISPPEGGRHMPIGPMILSFFALLLMALMLAGLMGHMGTPIVMTGVISGALVWLGFVITTIAVGNAFQGKKPMLTVIDGGHWLAVLLVQGIVLGLFG